MQLKLSILLLIASITFSVANGSQNLSDSNDVYGALYIYNDDGRANTNSKLATVFVNGIKIFGFLRNSYAEIRLAPGRHDIGVVWPRQIGKSKAITTIAISSNEKVFVNIKTFDHIVLPNKFNLKRPNPVRVVEPSDEIYRKVILLKKITERYPQWKSSPHYADEKPLPSFDVSEFIGYYKNGDFHDKSIVADLVVDTRIRNDEVIELLERDIELIFNTYSGNQNMDRRLFSMVKAVASTRDEKYKKMMNEMLVEVGKRPVKSGSVEYRKWFRLNINKYKKMYYKKVVERTTPLLKIDVDYLSSESVAENIEEKARVAGLIEKYSYYNKAIMNYYESELLELVDSKDITKDQINYADVIMRALASTVRLEYLDLAHKACHSANKKVSKKANKVLKKYYKDKCRK